MTRKRVFVAVGFGMMVAPVLGTWAMWRSLCREIDRAIRAING